MKTATRNDVIVSDDYLALVKQWPLRPLRSKADHRHAINMYARFAGHDSLTPGESDYIDALAVFIEQFEHKTQRDAMLAFTPVELLQHLMELHEMTTVDLGQTIGSKGLASEILNGKRGISRQVAQKLGERFAVSSSLFLRL